MKNWSIPLPIVYILPMSASYMNEADSFESYQLSARNFFDGAATNEESRVFGYIYSI